jgi:DNA-binding NarL/FixJ family response regulator
MNCKGFQDNQTTKQGCTDRDTSHQGLKRHKPQQVPDEASGPSSPPITPLTRAEARVLQYILTGMKNREIAAILHRSERTVEVHRSRIMKKLNAHNRVELVKSAMRLGFLGSGMPMRWQAEVG